MRSYFADFVLKFSASIVNNSIVVAVELFKSDNCNQSSGSFLSLPCDKARNLGENLPLSVMGSRYLIGACGGNVKFLR